MPFWAHIYDLRFGRSRYSYACCSPTRSSFISGRLPINVNILNTDPASFNASTGEGAGIATEMTGIGEVLARGGYSKRTPSLCSLPAAVSKSQWIAAATAVVGKWDVGMAVSSHAICRCL